MCLITWSVWHVTSSFSYKKGGSKRLLRPCCVEAPSERVKQQGMLKPQKAHLRLSDWFMGLRSQSDWDYERHCSGRLWIISTTWGLSWYCTVHWSSCIWGKKICVHQASPNTNAVHQRKRRKALGKAGKVLAGYRGWGDSLTLLHLHSPKVKLDVISFCCNLFRSDLAFW